MGQLSTRRRENIALLIAALGAVAALMCWRLAGESSSLFTAFRWIALTALVAYGCFRRTLTAWIFIAMLVGAEIGHDFPNVATNLRVLALIFLRLIKTIIAPLLFSTLVVGIAGHSNLRQVGRLGLRSIIYFEIVTTIAIFLGLAAINLTKAGVGVQLPATPSAETMPVASSARKTPSCTSSPRTSPSRWPTARCWRLWSSA